MNTELRFASDLEEGQYFLTNGMDSLTPWLRVEKIVLSGNGLKVFVYFKGKKDSYPIGADSAVEVYVP